MGALWPSPARSFPPAAMAPASSRAAPVTPRPPAGQQVIEEQRRRLAELKQRAAAEAQCQWDALHGAPPFPAGPSGLPPLMHSILHHLPGRERGEEGEHAYDTLSLESSDSMETSASAGHSTCSPDNVSRYPPAPAGQPSAGPAPHGTRPPARCRLSPLPPQCERPGRGEAGGDGADAERSSRREEPPRGVQGRQTGCAAEAGRGPQRCLPPDGGLRSEPCPPHAPCKTPLRRRAEGQGAVVRSHSQLRKGAAGPPSCDFPVGIPLCVVTSVDVVATLGLKTHTHTH